jgi:hypothetical protein
LSSDKTKIFLKLSLSHQKPTGLNAIHRPPINPVGRHASVIPRALIDPGTDCEPFAFRHSFPVVGHPDLLVCTVIDHGSQVTLERASRYNDRPKLGSFHKAVISSEIQATCLVSGATRLMAFQASELNDRKHVILEACGFLRGRIECPKPACEDGNICSAP